MTESELKKLNRAELLAMLISITQRCDKLEAELQDAYERLDGRDIEISRAGTLAEATIKINKIFEAADQAAAQYLANLQRMYPADGSAVALDASTLSAHGLVDFTQEREAAERETKAKCRAIEAEARKRCEEMVANARQESQAYWDEIYLRIRKYREAMSSMKNALEEDGSGR